MNPMETATIATEREVNAIPPAMHHDPVSARQELAAWDALHREEKHEVQERHSYFYVAGRLLLAALFLGTAYFKITHFSDTVGAVATAGYGDAAILVSVALLVELSGGLMLASGWRVRVAAAGLIRVPRHGDGALELGLEPGDQPGAGLGEPRLRRGPAVGGGARSRTLEPQKNLAKRQARAAEAKAG